MSEFVVNDDMFGTYVKIPTGYSKEMHIYKVVCRFKSNSWCEVPLTYQSETNPVRHNCLEDVLNVIHCGVDESKVVRVALKDCEIVGNKTDDNKACHNSTPCGFCNLFDRPCFADEETKEERQKIEKLDRFNKGYRTDYQRYCAIEDKINEIIDAVNELGGVRNE